MHVSKLIEPLPALARAAPLAGRSRRFKMGRFRRRRGKAKQRVFPFRERAERIERRFKMAIALFTIGAIGILLVALPSGRYLVSWLTARGRSLALHSVGLETDRSEIDAAWRRRRQFDIEHARGTLPGTFAEYPPPMQRLLQFVGLDPEHALVRPGNFDRTVLLPAMVFEPDDSGRAYRFQPKYRSIWVRNFPVKGQVKAYFQAPDRPELAELAKGTGASIVDGSVQTTNSWGLRGPEPDLATTWRGIALGDSFMQGLFVEDTQTPTECLKRDLTARLEASVEILNTGHLGYSPEQYYYSLVEYAERFPPQFVVISIFANDFGSDLDAVLQGRGDWKEGCYWLSRIRAFCAARQLICLFVPAPWVNQLEGPQLAGYYPGLISNSLEATGAEYLDPIADFVDAHLAAAIEDQRLGRPRTACSLFNGRIGDCHFSPRGSEVWAAAVGRRLALLIQRQRLAVESAKPGPIRHQANAPAAQGKGATK
jgi:hypothetical protein